MGILFDGYRGLGIHPFFTTLLCFALLYNLLGPSQQAHRLIASAASEPEKIPRLAFSCYRYLNGRKPHTTSPLCERTTFTKIINKNYEIAIINTKDQTVVHHSNRPVALASMNI